MRYERNKQSYIPELYETEDIPAEEKTIYQVYRLPSVGFYWLIAEYDPKEKTAFGYANLNDDQNAEWGYISIDELEQNGAILDTEWKPCSYREARKKIYEIE
jgi:hypothetical protein